MTDYPAELYKGICESSFCDGPPFLFEPEHTDEELKQMKENRRRMEAYAERQHVLQDGLFQETCVIQSGKSCSRSNRCTRGFTSQLH